MAMIKPVPDNEFLSAEEKRKIELEVQAEIEKEAKALEAEAYKQKYRRKLRQQADLEDKQVAIFIELPESSACLRIDGVAYLPNMTYTVGETKARSMREMMSKAWEHEAEINGRKKSFFVRRTETRLIGSSGAVQHLPV